MTTAKAAPRGAVDGIWKESRIYKGAVANATPDLQEQRLKGRAVHVKLLWCLVGLLAYLLLGAGWLIGAIGDAIWEVGKRMHQDKWRIE